jgi:hypothetical protein
LVDGTDATPDYLAAKLAAGVGITLTTLPGPSKQVEISAPGGTSDEQVKVTAADTTAGYLAAKLVAGANVTLTLLNPGANEQLRVDASSATKAPVATFAALPLVGNVVGDIRVTLDNGFGYVWNGTRWTSLGGANISQYARECEFFEDFLCANGTTIGHTTWFSILAGGGTNAVVGTTLLDGSHQGILSQQTGSTATGRSSVLQNGLSHSNVGAAGGTSFTEWLCNFEGPLSDGIDNYNVMYGYSSVAGAAGFGANAALLTYDPAVSATNWVARSIVGGVPTLTDTGIAIAAPGTWQSLGIALSSTGAVYTVGGVVGASHAIGTLPGATAGWAPTVKIEKTLGNGQRRIRTDYCAWGYRLAAPR